MSYTLRVALAISRTISASISFLAACIIVYKIVLRYRANRRPHVVGGCATSHHEGLEITTYHRMLLGIAILDLLHTSWAALSTLPVPASSGVVFGHGNTATCTAQGFFIQLSSAIPIYMASLNTYFMLKIRYNVPNDIIRKKYEPWFHLVPVVQALTSGFLGIALKLYNPIVIPEMGCWIALYPAFCDLLGNCTRGYNLDKRLDLYVWIFAYGWLFASFLVVLINSVLIYTAIRNLEVRNERYLFPTSQPDSKLADSNNSSLRLSSRLERSSLPSRILLVGSFNSQLPSEIQIENKDSTEKNNCVSNDTTTQENRENGESSNLQFETSQARTRKEKISRIAAFQSFLFCSSTFFVAFWVFMPWVAIKINATKNAIFFFAFMINIVNPSQGLFNLFIIVRIQYKRLRAKEKWSRLKCIRNCLFSPDIH